MDFNFTPEELAFRDEVRAFVDAELSPGLRDKVLGGKRLSKDDFIGWHKTLYRKGWVAPNWPVEYGGTGWTAVQRHIFEEELADAGAPATLPFGLRMVAPVIMAFGSPAQKEYFLPRILSGEHWWCQGYSEPGSGSDLASLKTRAERQGDKYIVNGQKTWTTLGQHADWIFCLVRTNPEARKQEGISFLLIDMKTPGITVRPIIMLDGEHEVNEVWFDNVEVPVDNRVGEENKGWTYAKFLLGHERTGIAEIGRSKRWLKQLKQIATQQPASDGGKLIDDLRFRDRVAQVEIELMALEVTNLRVIAAEMEHKAPGPEASLLKIRGSEIQQTLSELMMLALGHDALPFQHAALAPGYDGPLAGPDYGPPLTGQYFNMRKTTIYGGSNEIQKNIISKMILGF
ncbi:MAG: acyl-CoA dehydrogenase family protein [Sinimarinibacterium flocculans]|uniref:acyl-CoA dehydrogenase family protein n=1 Tax=Sinimarinibacterium flocculans TaxID=985250 RepID=UPI003C5A68EB